jgi:hypothetical protein
MQDSGNTGEEAAPRPQGFPRKMRFAKVDAMLIPRFSLRWLLVLTTVCAVFFLIMRWANQGSHWAVGIVTGVTALALAVLVHAAIFALAFVLSWLIGLVRPSSPGRSPFATDALPPQVIPPRNVDE